MVQEPVELPPDSSPRLSSLVDPADDGFFDSLGPDPGGALGGIEISGALMRQLADPNEMPATVEEPDPEVEELKEDGDGLQSEQDVGRRRSVHFADGVDVENGQQRRIAPRKRTAVNFFSNWRDCVEVSDHSQRVLKARLDSPQVSLGSSIVACVEIND